ncbi:unnamed protein product [Schistosoma curassoni]|uniref:Uncharacterized protein n=1 Tax=Schistosoma curassoni TaxID=6186 RepID=A0A183K9E2_9TREM|nr:unnamed protein product [Schistosoma curassoni]
MQCFMSEYGKIHTIFRQLNSSNINVSTEPPLIRQEETTSRTTEADIRKELELTTQNTETQLNSSNINATIESSLIKQEETTSRTTEADLRNELEIATQNAETCLNTTIEIIEAVQKTKSSHYVYIVIPIVVTSIILDGYITTPDSISCLNDNAASPTLCRKFDRRSGHFSVEKNEILGKAHILVTKIHSYLFHTANNYESLSVVKRSFEMDPMASILQLS